MRPSHPLVIITLVGGLLLLLVAGLYGLREVVLGPQLLRAANSYLAPALGVELRATAVGGNYFNNLEVRDLATVPAATDANQPPPVFELQAQELRLQYDLLALRHGPAEFLSTLEVELRRGRLELDTSAKPAPEPPSDDQTPPLPTAAELQEMLSAGVEATTKLPTIRLENMDFRFTDGERQFFATELTLQFTPGAGPGAGPGTGTENPTRLSLHSPDAGWRQPQMQPLHGPLSLVAQAHGGDRGGKLTITELSWHRGGNDPARAAQRPNGLLEAESARLTWSDQPRVELALNLKLLATATRAEAELTHEHWQGKLQLAPFNLTRLDELLLSPLPLAGELSATTHLELSPGAPWTSLSGELELQVHNGALSEHYLDDLDFKASLRHEKLHLPRLTARLGDNHLELRELKLPFKALLAGDYRQLLKRGEVAELTADLQHLPALATAAGWEVPIVADPETTLNLEPGTLRAALARHRLQLRASLAKGVLSLQETRLENESDYLDLPRASLGPWPQDDNLWELPISGEINLRLDDLARFTDDWQLPSTEGQLTANLELAGRPAAPEGKVQLGVTGLHHRNLQLEKLQLQVQGKMDNRQQPQLSGRLQAEKIKLLSEKQPKGLTGGPTLDELQMEFTLADQLLNLSDFTANRFHAEVEINDGRYTDWHLARSRGRFTFSMPEADPAQLELTGEIQAHRLQKEDRVLFNTLQTELLLDAGKLTVSQGEIDSEHGSLRLAGNLAGLGSEDITLQLDMLEMERDELELALKPPGRLRLTEGRLKDVSLLLQGHGADLKLEGGYDPLAVGNELDLQARLSSDDLAWLAPLLPGVRRLEGSMIAELDLQGSPADPDVRGRITMADGELRLTGDAPSLQGLGGQAQFDQQGIQIHAVNGHWGGAPFLLKGRLDLPPGFLLVPDEKKLAEELVFDLSLKGEELLFYRAEGIRVRGRTNLTIRGPLAALQVAGEVAVSDGRYTRNVDFLEVFRAPGAGRQAGGPGLSLFSLTKPPWREMTFDIRLIADRPFVVHTNMARGSLRPDLRLRGSGELPVLNGEIYLDPTRVTMPSGRFQIESGLVRFPEHDPDRPEFDLLATARLLGYDVQVVLQGTADQPILTLSSIPPLPDDELLLLVLTGQPPATMGAMGRDARRQAGMNMVMFLGRDMLARIFHGDEPPSDEALLERLHVDIGRNVTRSGDDTIEAELRLADDLLREDDQLFIISEKDVYDDFNIGLKIVFRFR